ncbi:MULTISPECIES: ArgE/DapE family deacylase [Mumia]|uniref:Probable succinyl-diaminopimelate desuccinylase n=1 Tax=Mumia xiangluensis TaxID=1678900 RepID=A0ABW1QGT4_9ACTN|nr:MULTISPECIES: ArgE/DapE family deacylase [Mumia]
MTVSVDSSAVLAHLDPDQIAADLATLVGLAPVDGTVGEVAASHWCADRLAELGAEVDHWEIDLPTLRQESEFPGIEVERTEAWGAVGILPGDNGGVPGLALAGHIDVVPPGDPALWADDPFTLRERDGTWYGRGVCDMLGGTAAVLGAAHAIRASGVRLARPLAVHTVIGEEDGGLGTFATLRRGHTADACVIAEPTAGHVVTDNAGSLTFRLVIRGRAAHGSMRTSGISALDGLDIARAVLGELEAERNADVGERFSHLVVPFPISIGTVHAGDWASTVPDLCVVEGRFGVRPGEPVAAAQTAFRAALAEAGRGDLWLRDHPIEVSFPGGTFAPGRLPDDHPLLGVVQDAAEDAGAPRPQAMGAPYGSDLRLYAAAGVPTVQYGPGDIAHAHAVNEYVEIEDVLRCARAYVLTALRLCS